MNKLTCRECPYFWTEDDEEYPSCHYESLGSWDPAPCEQDLADEPDKVNDLDVMDPVDYIDKYGVTLFSDRED